LAVQLDHLMWGAPSLAAGVREVERRFGVAPAPGGVHPGLGTANALLGLGDDVYLEVIAPDPAQQSDGNMGGRLAALKRQGLITWAVRTVDLEAVAARARGAGFATRGPVATERRAPDGSLLAWELLFVGDHPFGALLPFFIDWHDTPHPALTNPAGGRLERLEIRARDAGSLNRAFAALGMPFEADPATGEGLLATIGSPAGEVLLESAPGAAGWRL
jgi:hypothetical protein